MAAKPKEYRRLPGSGLRKQGLIAVTSNRSTLWLGRDHLLSINSERFSEDYKRFYFRDIQAIIIRKTHTGLVINIVFILLALPLLISSTFVSDSGGVAACLIISGLLLLVALINALMGPTCRCDLQTAVQVEQLPSLGRLRRARKVLAKLRPLIAEAQGELTREEIPARMAALSQPVATAGESIYAPPVIAELPAAPAAQPSQNPGEPS